MKCEVSSVTNRINDGFGMLLITGQEKFLLTSLEDEKTKCFSNCKNYWNRSVSIVFTPMIGEPMIVILKNPSIVWVNVILKRSSGNI